MTTKVAPVTLESFSIEPAIDQDFLKLTLRGTGDMAAVRHLDRCLQEAHQEVVALGLKGLELDITALYLLNSSCLKTLVSLVYKITTEGPHYAVRFVTDPHLSWQSRSLAVIVRMAPKVVSIAAQ